MKDPTRTKSNFRCLPSGVIPVHKNKEGYLRKTKVLDKFTEYNKKERENYHSEHLVYDKIYNECIFDTALEILECERYLKAFILSNL